MSLCEHCNLKKAMTNGNTPPPSASSDQAQESGEKNPLDEILEEEEELNNRFFEQNRHRQEARECQKQQANRMLASSNKRYAPIAVGTSVLVPVPDVDRSKVYFIWFHFNYLIHFI